MYVYWLITPSAYEDEDEDEEDITTAVSESLSSFVKISVLNYFLI